MEKCKECNKRLDPIYDSMEVTGVNHLTGQQFVYEVMFCSTCEENKRDRMVDEYIDREIDNWYLEKR